MIIYRSKLGILGETQRIKMARGRLEEINFSLPTSLFDGTETHSSLIIAGKSTISTVNDSGDEITLFIYICDTIGVDFFAGARQLNQRRRSLNSIVDREAQSISLSRAVIWILAYDNHFYLIKGTSIKSGKYLLTGGINYFTLGLYIVEKCAEL